MGKKIWIKANGNGTVATGHIRRCMTIADELAKRGAQVEFILSDERSANVLLMFANHEDMFFDSRILHTEYSEPMEDLPILEDILREEHPDFFLVDSPYVKPEYFEELNKIKDSLGIQLETGYIDDLGKLDYPVNLMLNYKVGFIDDVYKSADIKLLGAEYAPLRKDFSCTEYELRETGVRVFLSAGGTDPYHVIGDILSEIYEGDSPCRKVLDYTGVECEVIVGSLFEAEYKRSLYELAECHQSITLHDYVNDMPSLMRKCDFAVSAGGMTLYELCAVGVPTVVFSMADSQVESVQAFDQAGAVKYAGDARDDHRLVQKIVTWGTAAVENKGFRGRMSDRARLVIDGKGLDKIADAILK